jgi:mannan endo-1,4-beta-mannosidase
MRVSHLLSIFLGTVTASGAAIATDLEERATGFVTRSGTGFALDGKPFYFMGTNSYWLDQLSR